MGVAMTGAANGASEGSWLEGGGINGLSFKISRLLQPPINPKEPIAIAVMTAASKIFMRPIFT
jgi:hypothetical protein